MTSPTSLFFSTHPLYVHDKLPQYYIGEVKGYKCAYDWNTEFYRSLRTKVDNFLSKTKHSSRDSNFEYVKSILIILLFLIAYYYYIVYNSSIAGALFGFFLLHMGLQVGHYANHGGFSSSILINNLGCFTMDMIGYSSVVWKIRHNMGHHASTNNMNVDKNDSSCLEPLAYDPDAADMYPLVRLHPALEYKWFHRYQHFYYPVLGAGYLVYMFLDDIYSFCVRRFYYLEFYHITIKQVIQLLFTKFVVLYFVVLLPIQLRSFKEVQLSLFATIASASYTEILNLNINHLGDDSHYSAPTLKDHDKQTKDWAKLQVMSSCNFAIESSFWAIFSGYLNLQIEHHLFPAISAYHLPRIRPIVQEHCKQHGLPYPVLPSWWSMMYHHWLHVRHLSVPPQESEVVLNGASRAKKIK